MRPVIRSLIPPSPSSSQVMLFSAKAIWFLASLFYIPQASASVTVYSQLPFGKPTTTAPSFANYTAPSAFDPINLKAPAIPNPPPGNKFNIQVAASNTTQNGLSITTAGSFFGFSNPLDPCFLRAEHIWFRLAAKTAHDSINHLVLR